MAVLHHVVNVLSKITDDIAEVSELEAWLEDEEQKRSSALRWWISRCDNRSLTDLLHTGHRCRRHANVMCTARQALSGWQYVTYCCTLLKSMLIIHVFYQS